MTPPVTRIVQPDSNRLGKFRILTELLRDGRERPMLEQLFGLCALIKKERDETGRGTMYYCSGPLFQQLDKPGAEIPEYRIECYWPDQQMPNPAHERDAIRTEKGFRFRAVRQFIVRVPPATFRARVAGPR